MSVRIISEPEKPIATQTPWAEANESTRPSGEVWVHTERSWQLFQPYEPQCQSLPCGSYGKESACNAQDLGSILGSGRSTGEENSYPLQYSYLENSMDRGAWQATIHGVPKSWTRLSKFHFHFFTNTYKSLTKYVFISWVSYTALL